MRRGPTGIHTRENALEPSESRRREPRARDETLRAHLELIATWLAVELHQPADEPAIGDRHGIAQHLDATQRFERQVDVGDPGRRIADVEAVDQQGRLIGPGAADAQQSVGAPDDRRQQRQRLLGFQPVGWKTRQRLRSEMSTERRRRRRFLDECRRHHGGRLGGVRDRQHDPRGVGS